MKGKVQTAVGGFEHHSVTANFREIHHVRICRRYGDAGAAFDIDGRRNDTACDLDPGAAEVGGTVKEGTRVGLEKTWDAGSMAASKSKDAAKVSLKGAKVAGGAAKRKADSMIRRNDEDTAPEVEEVFASKPEWRKLEFAVKDGMVTIKLPTKSNVDVGALVSEVRKVAGVRSVFVIAL